MFIDILQKVLTRIISSAIFMIKKVIRKPRNVLMDPEALLKARVEALRSKRDIGQVD